MAIIQCKNDNLLATFQLYSIAQPKVAGVQSFLLAQSDISFTPNSKSICSDLQRCELFLKKEGNSKAFELTRAFIGYEYFFSRNISSKINIDLADPGVGELKMIYKLNLIGQVTLG